MTCRRDWYILSLLSITWIHPGVVVVNRPKVFGSEIGGNLKSKSDDEIGFDMT